jgi:hypothetical protein
MSSLFFDSPDEISIMRPQHNPGDEVSLYKDYLLLLLVTAIRGTPLSVIKIGVTKLVPATLIAGRILIVALVLSGTFLAHGVRRGASCVL